MLIVTWHGYITSPFTRSKKPSSSSSSSSPSSFISEYKYCIIYAILHYYHYILSDSTTALDRLTNMKLINSVVLTFVAVAVANPIAAPDAAAVAEPVVEKRVGEDCKIVRRFQFDLEGTCVDTRKPVCRGGQLYSGYCPGPNYNRCCIT